MLRAPESTTGPAERFFSVSEAAKILKVSEVTIYRGINAGQFPAVKIRGRYVVPAKAIDQLEASALEQVAAETERTDWLAR
jgi:excisionase family DNA binding protein